MEPLPVVEKSQANCALLRGWASSYGAAVRQRTVYQETTMVKHGTLPEYMYHRQCIILDTPVTSHLCHTTRVTRLRTMRMSMTPAVTNRLK